VFLDGPKYDVRMVGGGDPKDSEVQNSNGTKLKM